MPKRYCLLSSTGASVARRVWTSDERFRSGLKLVITDRECGASDFARSEGVPHVIIREVDPVLLSQSIGQVLDAHQIDYTFCFFTRLLKGELCTTKGNNIFNFHPSLLPACPGMHGFEDSLASGALVIGSTVHTINETMDGGKIIIQSVLASRPVRRDPKALRHHLFLHQCAQLLQVFLWTENDKLVISESDVQVKGADYSGTSLHFPAFDDHNCCAMAQDIIR